MTERRSIEVIPACLDRDALRRMHACELEEAIYYPYRHFSVVAQLPGLTGRRATRSDCLVDARLGHAATADTCKTEMLENSENWCLEPLISHEAAARAANRYLSHAYSRNLKVIADFRIALNGTGIVYKKFWLALAVGRQYIVDSVTGQLHCLPRAQTGSNTAAHSACNAYVHVDGALHAADRPVYEPPSA
jgi:hypothetical protein